MTIKNSHGVALLMAVASIMMMSMIALEFVYTTTINYQLAINERDRLKAFYLAESAANLMKMELKIEKSLKSNIKGQDLSKYLPPELASGALCAQFPMSTELLRGILPGSSESSEKEEQSSASSKGFVSMVQEDKAKDFLSFDGDFEGECEDEQAKWNVNIFYGLDPLQEDISGVNRYDVYKRMLVEFLSSPQMKPYFVDKSQRDINDIVRNIADYQDKDERMNEFGGIAAGNEDSIYSGRGESFKMKNRKFVSLDELYLVEGVTDDWFTPVREQFTIYGDGKINICSSSDELLRGVISGYSQSNTKFTPIRSDNKESMDKILEIIHTDCALGGTLDVGGISKKVEMVLQGEEIPESEAGAPPPPPTAATGGFADYVTTEDRFYLLKTTGRVGDIAVQITSVVDTQGGGYKVLYRRIN